MRMAHEIREEFGERLTREDYVQVARVFYSAIVPKRKPGRRRKPQVTAAHANWKAGIRGVALYRKHIPGWQNHNRYRRPSREAAAGIHEGQQVERISGRSVGTIGQLRQLLDEHRQHPWLRMRAAAPASGYPAQPIDLAVDRPLPRSLPVHPTQLYSTIDALILCLLLLVYDRFRRRDGELTALMITIYPITRFLIENIRTDEASIWGTGLHISQNISLGILAAAICLWFYIFAGRQNWPLRAVDADYSL